MILAAILLAAPAAYAHSPLFNDRGSPSLSEAFVIDDVEVSKAIMGAIRRAGLIDYYRFEVPAGHVLRVSLFVPVACEGFFPQMALIGPDLAPGPPPVLLEIPSGYAAQEIRLPEADWGIFFEPFDPAFYHAGPELTITGQGAPAYLAVYASNRNTGAYMLGTSGSEQWQPAENWRERKAAYDRCEFGQASWLLRNWRDLTVGLGLVGMGVVTGSILFRRIRSMTRLQNTGT